MSQISWVVPRYIISIIDIVFTNYYFLSMAFSDQFYHWLLLSHHAANSQIYCSHEAWESPNIQKRDRKNSDPTGSQTRATLCTSGACMMLNCSLSIPCIESLIASAIHLLWALCSLLNSKPLARSQLGLNTWRPKYGWHGIYWWLMALQGVGSIDVYVQELHMPSCQTFMRKYLNLWDIIYAIIVNS